ncbi:uncharacterized protein LOC141592190 [Silene latifolia]|uniref:uncharacterized protein LOC141592190 n=1 Tax=Silene latifolia TaxID=37657 RepID=UPI003D787712
MEISCSSLMAAMDNIWFYQIVLLPQPISPTTCSKPGLQSSNLTDVSDHTGEDSVSIDSSTSSITSQDDPKTVLEEVKAVVITETEIPSRLSLKSNQSQSIPTLLPKHTPRTSLTYTIDNGQRLQSIFKCKILRDLEQLELKGFMDLGFEFEKERLSPRTINVIPGLKRIGKQTTSSKTSNVNENQQPVVKVEPYLSDAWSVKKPNSPLLRLRMARVSTSQDMKECLKLWARTVVSSVVSVQ